MTFLRHAPRHVHQSVINYVVDQLKNLGWMQGPGSPDVPFGLPAVKVLQSRPFIGSQLDNRIGPGIVTVTLGTEFAPALEELGGPLSTQEYPIFCDVFMEQNAGALALASDIRDAFLGRHDSSKTSIPVINQTTSTPVENWRIYFEDIERIVPEHSFPLAWQSVHVTASVKFPEVVY